MVKKEHLRKILKVDRGSPSYAEMDTEIKNYNKFINQLKLNFFNKDSDEIFIKLYNEGSTLKSITAKSRGKEHLEIKLMEFAKKQKAYYKNNIYPLFISNILKKHKLSDADILRNEHENRHSIILTDNYKNIFYLDNFLSNFLERWYEFNGYLDKTLQLIFFDYYNQAKFRMLNILQFKKLVDEVIQEYMIIKENHKNYKKEIQRENPYYNVYMYFRNAYILNYFELDLPDDFLFKEYKNYNATIPKKEFYSLKDIAKSYEIITGIESKAYDRIKKNFQKNTYMKKYKNNNGEYVFSNLSIPLAHYIYYRKKNHSVEKDTDFFGYNHIIYGRIAPILNAKINNDKERLEAVYKYLSFIRTEYRDIFSTLNNGYQNKMIYFLNETIVNLFYRSLGLSKQIVYSNYKKDY